MKPAINLIQHRLRHSNHEALFWRLQFDQLNEILTTTKPEVDSLLENRKSQGEIKDVNQSRKSIAGNAFSGLIIYIFLQNKRVGNIISNAFITSKPSEIPMFNKVFTINVGGETQKP